MANIGAIAGQGTRVTFSEIRQDVESGEGPQVIVEPPENEDRPESDDVSCWNGFPLTTLDNSRDPSDTISSVAADRLDRLPASLDSRLR